MNGPKKRTKASIKRILSRKRLSGLEAGRLLLEDSWEVDHGREGFLSLPEDIQILKEKLRTEEDYDHFNRLIETYRLLDYTLREADSCYQKITIGFAGLSAFLLAARIDSQFKELRAIHLPYVVSETEYEALLAEHQKTKSGEFTPGPGLGPCFAILKNPPKEMLNEDGTSMVSEMLETFRLSSAGWKVEAERFLGTKSSEYFETLNKTHSATKERIAEWLAYYEVTRMVSDFVKVRFTEDFEKEGHSLCNRIFHYNCLLVSVLELHQDLSLEIIEPDALEPSERMVLYLKERMALSLFPEWSDILPPTPPVTLSRRETDKPGGSKGNA